MLVPPRSMPMAGVMHRCDNGGRGSGKEKSGDTCADEQPHNGDDTDDEIDGEADLALREDAEDDAEHTADECRPLEDAEEGDDTDGHPGCGEEAEEDGEELAEAFHDAGDEPPLSSAHN